MAGLARLITAIQARDSPLESSVGREGKQKKEKIGAAK